MQYSKEYFQQKYPSVQFISGDIDISKAIQLKDEDAFSLFIKSTNIKHVIIKCVYEEKEPITIEKEMVKEYFAEFRDYEPYDKSRCEFIDFSNDVDLFEEYNWQHDKQFEKLIIMKSQEWSREALKQGPFQSIDTGIYIRYNNQWVSLQCSSSVGTEYDFTTVDDAILYLIETELPQYIKGKQSSMSSGGIK